MLHKSNNEFGHSSVTRHFYWNLFPGSLPEVGWNLWRLKNSSRMKWCVFLTALGEKPLQNNQSLGKYCLWSCKAAAFFANMDQIFCFMRNKTLIMQRMQMLANYNVCGSTPSHPLRCPVEGTK